MGKEMYEKVSALKSLRAKMPANLRPIAQASGIIVYAEKTSNQDLFQTEKANS